VAVLRAIALWSAGILPAFVVAGETPALLAWRARRPRYQIRGRDARAPMRAEPVPRATVSEKNSIPTGCLDYLLRTGGRRTGSFFLGVEFPLTPSTFCALARSLTLMIAQPPFLTLPSVNDA